MGGSPNILGSPFLGSLHPLIVTFVTYNTKSALLLFFSIIFLIIVGKIPSISSSVSLFQQKRDALCFEILGFLGGSDGKESACNAGDPGSTLGLGRHPGEENGYPL